MTDSPQSCSAASEQDYLEDNIATLAHHLAQPGAFLCVHYDGAAKLLVDPGEVLKEASRRLSPEADPSAATEGEIDFNDPLTSRIMGAARLHTHDHTMAYNITRDVLAVLDEPQGAPVTHNAAVLAERLIQAAADYESGRCSKREMAEARAAVEAAIGLGSVK